MKSMQCYVSHVLLVILWTSTSPASASTLSWSDFLGTPFGAHNTLDTWTWHNMTIECTRRYARVGGFSNGYKGEACARTSTKLSHVAIVKWHCAHQCHLEFPGVPISQVCVRVECTHVTQYRLCRITCQHSIAADDPLPKASNVHVECECGNATMMTTEGITMLKMHEAWLNTCAVPIDGANQATGGASTTAIGAETTTTTTATTTTTTATTTTVTTATTSTTTTTATTTTATTTTTITSTTTTTSTSTTTTATTATPKTITTTTSTTTTTTTTTTTPTTTTTTTTTTNSTTTTPTTTTTTTTTTTSTTTTPTTTTTTTTTSTTTTVLSSTSSDSPCIGTTNCPCTTSSIVAKLDRLEAERRPMNAMPPSTALKDGGVYMMLCGRDNPDRIHVKCIKGRVKIEPTEGCAYQALPPTEAPTPAS